MPCSKQPLKSSGTLPAARGGITAQPGSRRENFVVAASRTKWTATHLCVFDVDSMNLRIQDLADHNLLVGEDLIGNQPHHFIHPVGQGVHMCLARSDASTPKHAAWIEPDTVTTACVMGLWEETWSYWESRPPRMHVCRSRWRPGKALLQGQAGHASTFVRHSLLSTSAEHWLASESSAMWLY